MQEAKISVVGLGKLGSPLVGVLANAGHHVIGIDVNPTFVAALNRGESPINEPQLDDYITQNKQRISATTDYQHAISNTDITFIIVPTPSQGDGFFSNDYVLAAIKEIGHCLRDKASRHLIVITSTVMPTSMDRVIVPALEQAAAKKVGTDIGVCYSPHFIALGTVIKNMEYPDFILVGASDTQAAEQLTALYRSYCKNDPAIQQMNFINAEITKISVNSYITTKISFANMLSGLCDQLAGANVDVITDSMGMDKRIGRAYLKAGSAYGGPCFPRDNIAFSKFAQSIGVPADIAVSADAINYHQITRIINYAKACEAQSVCVLGLSYKTDCNFALVSFGVALANQLATLGYPVTAYDPQVTTVEQTSLDNTVTFTTELTTATANAEFIILTNPDQPLLAELQRIIEQHSDRHYIVVDCWRMAATLHDIPHCDVIAIGTGNNLIPTTVAGDTL